MTDVFKPQTHRTLSQSFKLSGSSTLVYYTQHINMFGKLQNVYLLVCATFLTIGQINGRHHNVIITAPTPPDHKDYVAMTRFVVHQADWAAVATISTLPNIKNYPFPNIVSMSDGTVEKSIGIPYFYLTHLDFTSKDLTADNRCTISVTLEETEYCQQHNYDPDDPRCARAMLSGRMVRLINGTEEYNFAKEALFSRHHSMANLPADHKFYVAKLQLEQIVMLDWFGGPKFISVEEYLAYGNGQVYKPSPFSPFKNYENNTI